MSVFDKLRRLRVSRRKFDFSLRYLHISKYTVRSLSGVLLCPLSFEASRAMKGQNQCNFFRLPKPLSSPVYQPYAASEPARETVRCHDKA